MSQGLSNRVRRVLAAVHEGGVAIPPWTMEIGPGGSDSLRKNSIGIMSGCSIEHDHDADSCLVTEFAIVCTNDGHELAGHPTNSKSMKTAWALVESFNLLAEHGAEILRRVEGNERP